MVEAKLLLLQLLKVLAHLYFHNMVHQDLKPANILIKSPHPFCIRITNFGLIKDSSVFVLSTFCGTELYVALETNTKKYDLSVNMWSLGVIGL
jgi:serine/threonine protein kinase